MKCKGLGLGMEEHRAGAGQSELCWVASEQRGKVQSYVDVWGRVSQASPDDSQNYEG